MKERDYVCKSCGKPFKRPLTKGRLAYYCSKTCKERDRRARDKAEDVRARIASGEIEEVAACHCCRESDAVVGFDSTNPLLCEGCATPS